MGDNAAVSQSTAAKKTVPCEECGKTLASKQSLTNHVLKIHRKIEETSRSPLVQSTSSVLTSAPAPPSTPAPTSQTGPSLAATMTNATMAAPASFITPASLTSPALLMTPAAMAAPAAKPRQLFSPGTEEALQEEEDVLKEAKEEQDLYEALDFITQNVINPDTEKDTRDTIKVKIERYKSIMHKKNKVIKEAMEKVKALEHDANCRTEIEDNQKIEIDEKDAENALLKSHLKKEEKEHEKSKNQYKADIAILQESVSNVTKINNDLKTEVNTQKKVIANLVGETHDTEQSEVNVEVHRERVDMTKESSTHTCNACEKVFKAAGDLDKHMDDKHTESDCHMCNKTFRSRKDAHDHICLEGDIVPQKCEKPHCNKEFVSTAALAKHMKSSHIDKQRSVCTNCGEIINMNKTMKSHTDICGKKVTNSNEKSREVCRHWRRGKCNRGQGCNFSHVGQQDISGSQSQSAARAQEPCRNGPSCSYLAKGRCKFDHHKAPMHINRAPQQPRSNQQRGLRQQAERTQCRFGANCDRVVNCPHLHNIEDFPMYDSSQRFRRTNRASNNQNWSRS